MDQGDWIPTGGEGFGEIGGVSVEVVGMATDAPSPSDKRIRNLAFDGYWLAIVVVEILLEVGGFDMVRGAELTVANADTDIQESYIGRRRCIM